MACKIVFMHKQRQGQLSTAPLADASTTTCCELLKEYAERSLHQPGFKRKNPHNIWKAGL